MGTLFMGRISDQTGYCDNPKDRYVLINVHLFVDLGSFVFFSKTLFCT